MAKKTKKKIESKTRLFKWQPDGAITWVLDEPREKFDRKVILMPLSVLIEEYGYLREAQGCLIMQYKGETSKDYFNDPRGKELRYRVNAVETCIQRKYYDQVAALERMEYYNELEYLTKEEK